MNYQLQELEEMYKKLGEQIKKLKAEECKIGFRDDQIFLLSVEEYKKYKKVIPHKNCWWWLRSPGYYDNFVAVVCSDGSICDRGDCILNCGGAVRPAIKYSENKLKTLGALFTKYGTTWGVIDPFEQIAIAENPIHVMRFDGFNNNYESSDIRAFLLKWVKERQDM